MFMLCIGIVITKQQGYVNLAHFLCVKSLFLNTGIEEILFVIKTLRFTPTWAVLKLSILMQQQ